MLTVAAKPAPQYVQPWGYDCHSGHRSGREVVRPRTSPSMPSHSISYSLQYESEKDSR